MEVRLQNLPGRCAVGWRSFDAGGLDGGGAPGGARARTHHPRDRRDRRARTFPPARGLLAAHGQRARRPDTVAVAGPPIPPRRAPSSRCRGSTASASRTCAQHLGVTRMKPPDPRRAPRAPHGLRELPRRDAARLRALESNDDHAYRATSADGVVLAVRSSPTAPKATWVLGRRRRRRLRSAGYTLDGDPRPVQRRRRAGHPAPLRPRLQRPPSAYWTTVFREGARGCTWSEAGGDAGLRPRRALVERTRDRDAHILISPRAPAR